MATKNKFYTVWDGHTPGVYSSWKDCQIQIKNYLGAKYKGFPTKEAATEALNGNYWEHVGKQKKAAINKELLKKVGAPIMNSISVDAACSGNPGTMEYRGVLTHNKKEIFKMGPYQHSTNNIGEFLALVHILALAKRKGDKRPIYSDSRTAMSWVRNKKVKTTLKPNARNQDSFELVERALAWLQTNSYENPILKWETKAWGEIPADFGRK
ncbi:ribonuclease H1 domain-containing protein [Nonlabens ponticola]|uniref:Ribonuclease H n=1 Tax=Nonlabens ponticola TaxID=2496866 RepID=A0A3S9MVX6_9FLAO|nr:ribonuclease H family protein [Nonlabens ponticola]AZQ43376.1 ribonuclease H [Nonlabens ponticola]